MYNRIMHNTKKSFIKVAKPGKPISQWNRLKARVFCKKVEKTSFFHQQILLLAILLQLLPQPREYGMYLNAERATIGSKITGRECIIKQLPFRISLFGIRQNTYRIYRFMNKFEFEFEWGNCFPMHVKCSKKG